jgi:glycosyltransferase involved in cell wall biosynthesis
MSNVLIVPEKNERLNPLKVVEEGLKSESINEVYIIDGWSTDNTRLLLKRRLPKLAKKYGKNVELHCSKLRNAGKGTAMVTGMEIALDKGHSNIVFMDGDIVSITSKWFDLLINGMQKYNADMTRGYFDRSSFDAQITRHVTVPSINMFFPEGRGINQPLGGEICMKSSFAQFLLDYHIAPPSTWGIDTFITVTALVEGFNVVELYLSQKLHKGKTLRELENMFLECFDEMAKLIHFHGRNRKIPPSPKTNVKIIPKSESKIERVGKDVRKLTYMDFNSELDHLFSSIKNLKLDFKSLGKLGLKEEDCKGIVRLSRSLETFKKESVWLGAERWVQILSALLRGYIKQQFSSRYHSLLFNVWRMRALAFCLNEATSFEKAEENTRIQAEYAFELGQREFANKS